MGYRIKKHPILGTLDDREKVNIFVDGKNIQALKGESIASAVIASGKDIFRYTKKYNRPRSLFCGIGQCNDCMMIVNGIPNIKTCITPVRDGMKIQTQIGSGKWKK